MRRGPTAILSCLLLALLSPAASTSSNATNARDGFCRHLDAYEPWLHAIPGAHDTWTRLQDVYELSARRVLPDPYFQVMQRHGATGHKRKLRRRTDATEVGNATVAVPAAVSAEERAAWPKQRLPWPCYLVLRDTLCADLLTHLLNTNLTAALTYHRDVPDAAPLLPSNLAADDLVSGGLSPYQLQAVPDARVLCEAGLWGCTPVKRVTFGAAAATAVPQSQEQPGVGFVIAVSDSSTKGRTPLSVLARLVARLSAHPHHRLLLHVDTTSPDLLERVRAVLPADPVQAARVSLATHHLRTNWGGASLVAATLLGMANLVHASEEGEAGGRFQLDFVVNLSESDFPLVSNCQLADFLATVRNVDFVQLDRAASAAAPLARFPDQFYLPECAAWPMSVRGLAPDPLALTAHAARATRLLGGDSGGGTATRVYTGSQWFVLSGDTARAIARDPWARDLYLYLRHTFIPDETYFTTAVMARRTASRASRASPASPASPASVAFTNLRYINTRKGRVIAPSELDRLAAVTLNSTLPRGLPGQCARKVWRDRGGTAPLLFARKFQRSAVLEALLERVEERV